MTDTFGTPNFLKAFKKPIPTYTTAEPGSAATTASVAASSTLSETATLGTTEAPIHAPITKGDGTNTDAPTFAQTFTGVRQDSGDPKDFIKMMRAFYDAEGVKDRKTIVFSDSLNIELCLEYKKAAEAEGFQPTFGVGTFLTSKCGDARWPRLYRLLTIPQMISCVGPRARSRCHSTLSSR